MRGLENLVVDQLGSQPSGSTTKVTLRRAKQAHNESIKTWAPCCYALPMTFFLLIMFPYDYQ